MEFPRHVCSNINKSGPNYYNTFLIHHYEVSLTLLIYIYIVEELV